jgi:hypothetical protein
MPKRQVEYSIHEWTIEQQKAIVCQSKKSNMARGMPSTKVEPVKLSAQDTAMGVPTA